MDRTQRVQAYFDAWNAHDADAIVATFGEGGTYTDPTTPGPLGGPAIGENAAGLWAAFPDVSFELTSHVDDGQGLYAAQWIMRGINSGSFAGLPPTGRSVVVRGADFIVVEDDGIASVDGYFDAGAVPRQLGMQVLVQPDRVGPFAFGNAVRVGGAIDGPPGAFSITSLRPRGPDEIDRVREISRETAAQMTGLDGFMGWVGVTVGDRMLTITAWSSPDDPKQVMRLEPHRDGTKGFFGTDLAAGGWVSVWTPEKIGPVWVRCEACGTMTDRDGADGVCSCGEDLPDPGPRW